MTILRNRLLAAAMLCILSTLTTAWAIAKPAYDFNLPQQSLADALRAIGRQTTMNILFEPESVENLTAPAVRGLLSPEEAIKRVLVGTKLVVEQTTANSLLIALAARVKSTGRLDSEGHLAGNRQNCSGLSTDKLGSSTPSNRTGSGSTSNGRTGLEAENGCKSQKSQGNVALARGEGAEGMEPVQPNDGESSLNSDLTSSVKIEEIVVTAQKRKERLKDVPISISVLSGPELDSSRVEGIAEALNRVPGVTTTVSVQGGGAQVAVRGVTASSALFSGSNPIAYYFDSVPFGLVKTAITPDGSAYDLERVEVLRGPQGTLYGASAQNGVVRILTKDANLDAFELKARTSISTTEDSGENYRGDMAVNVPIVEGKLAARAVVGYQDLSGWIDRPNDQDANDAQLRNMRLKINAQPTEKLSIGLSAWLSRDDYGAPPASDNRGLHSSLADESIATDYDAYGFKIGYDFPSFSVSSMTSYLSYVNDSNLDLAPYFSLTAPLALFSGLDAKVFAQEVLLT